MGKETKQQIIPSNRKLELKSCKGGFALPLSSSLLPEFILRKSSGLLFPTTNAGEIFNDECFGSWQCCSLETIKCWNLFLRHMIFAAQRPTKKQASTRESLRLLQMARSFRTACRLKTSPTNCGSRRSSQHLHILNHAGFNTNPSTSEMPSAPREQLKPSHMWLSCDASTDKC